MNSEKLLLKNINCNTLGGLFSADEEEQEFVFRFATESINADPTILPKTQIVPQIERIGKHDSFHANKRGIHFIHLITIKRQKS